MYWFVKSRLRAADCSGLMNELPSGPWMPAFAGMTAGVSVYRVGQSSFRPPSRNPGVGWGRVLPESSVDLIREAREIRDAQLDAIP